jgi:hypothetical protein
VRGWFRTQSGGHDRCDSHAGRVLSELTAVGQLAGRSQISSQHGLAGISPWAVGEELCHEEWLGQEPLNLPRSLVDRNGIGSQQLPEWHWIGTNVSDTPEWALAMLLISSIMNTVLPTPAPPNRPIFPPRLSTGYKNHDFNACLKDGTGRIQVDVSWPPRWIERWNDGHWQFEFASDPASTDLS